MVEKIKIIREYRKKQYENLIDVIYKRRGWTNNEVPTIEHLNPIRMDLPEVIEVIKPKL